MSSRRLPRIGGPATTAAIEESSAQIEAWAVERNSELDLVHPSPSTVSTRRLLRPEETARQLVFITIRAPESDG